jgi:ATP-binding cassette, subfamily G (WHITE), member 2, PDR
MVSFDLSYPKHQLTFNPSRINYLNPVAYGFESLMINEFAGRQFPCLSQSLVPNYDNVTLANQVCSAVGARIGQPFVNGDSYLLSTYNYQPSHKWRNLGILLAFLIGLMLAHLIASEYISAKKSKGEVLVFQRGRLPPSLVSGGKNDVESHHNSQAPFTTSSNDPQVPSTIQTQTAVFQWRDVCYDIKIKGEPRRILDHVDGWVKPGTLTALMGVSGAGKTTLLDVLAKRVTMGVISGEMLVDGHPRDSSFQRKTGYVQQQDLHLSTSTVREALQFSAILRQPKDTPTAEKVAYVEDVIQLLDMQEYADAVVGILGEGLNVEQRKRLTIGVELAAKPQLLLFLDEPTSGLDSQTSWSILNLLDKLTKNGQAILCTIHQPSAMLFQRFDRLLFLAKGGRTVYFGPVGESSKTLTSYFERHGAAPCPPAANPAEWMLEVIGAAPGSKSEIDWPAVWRQSSEYQDVQEELSAMRRERSQLASPGPDAGIDPSSYREFAVDLWTQWLQVQKRVFQQHWRIPSYIYSKLFMCAGAALFIGFSFFNTSNTRQGLQNQMLGIFMLTSVFGQLVQQLMPLFVTQRSLYEVRERPSKAYSWKAFVVSNIIGDLPWNLVCASLMYFCWYYPVSCDPSLSTRCKARHHRAHVIY